MLQFVHTSALALTVPGTDWLYQFTNNLTDLTTANGGALTSMGMVLLSFISFLMLVNMVISYSTANMTLSFNSEPLDVGQLIRFLLRLIFCLVLESYWVSPYPGSNFGLNHLFSYAAQQIVTALDQDSLANFNVLLNNARSGITAPAMLAPVEIICYFVVQLILGLAGGIIFVINVSSFIFYAITALFGPLFIPLYMTNSLRGKFFHFLEVLLSFAMIRAVAAAFIFVWEGFMNTFLTQTFNGDYSIGMWVANLVPVLVVFVAFFINMLFIPTITQAIFTGGAHAVGNAPGVVGRAASIVAKVAG